MEARRFPSRRCTRPAGGAQAPDPAEDRRLLRDLDRDFERASVAAGDWLVCHAGCSDCCFGPFPVTRLDVWRLRRGLDELERVDPRRAGGVARRARAAVEKLAPGYPGDPATGRLTGSVTDLDSYFERHAGLPCPALDVGTGRCELYDSRPVACRTYGPPLAFEGRASAPCPLCFEGAPPTTVESCRLEPDAAGRERRLLDELGVSPGEEWETLIAFALSTPR